jgi:hypothetical protein
MAVDLATLRAIQLNLPPGIETRCMERKRQTIFQFAPRGRNAFTDTERQVRLILLPGSSVSAGEVRGRGGTVFNDV